MITIFTATYNRAYILPILYNSLQNQTNQDFEWIIVDDNSSDNTQEVVGKFSEVGKGIRYYHQEHGGKHRAFNLGVRLAKGDYFFNVDSDDSLMPDAVEKVIKWINDIQEEDKWVVGVAGLRVSGKGEAWGGRPENITGEYIEATNLERPKYNLMGDKAEVYSVEILKQFPFPEYEGEFFVTEAVVWDAIAIKGYKLRWYDEPIYRCEYLEDGLTKTGANDRDGHLKNPLGFAKYVEVEMNAIPINRFIWLFGEYHVVSEELNISIAERSRRINITPIRYYTLYMMWIAFRIRKKLIG